jgi:retinol dehydrogenase 12
MQPFAICSLTSENDCSLFLKQAGRPSRVVNVSSKLHAMGHVCRDDPHLRVPGAYTSLAAYAQSKLVQVLFAGELQRRGGGNLVAVAVHPGEVATDVVRSLPGPVKWLYRIFMGAILLTPRQGARSSVYCATSDDLEAPGVRGAIYVDSNCRPKTPSREARDPQLAAWVWDWSVSQVGLKRQEGLPPAAV